MVVRFVLNLVLRNRKMCQREGEFVCGCGAGVQLLGVSAAFTHLVSMVTEQAKLYFL